MSRVVRKDLLGRFTAHPGVHFMALGVVLLGLVHLSAATIGSFAATRPDTKITFTAADVATINDDFKRSFGYPPTSLEQGAAISQAADDEMLYREALTRRLYVGDRAVEGRLISGIDFIDDNPSLSSQDKIDRAVALGLDKTDIVVRRILIEKIKTLSALEAGAEHIGAADLEHWYATNKQRFRLPSSVDFVHIFLGNGDRAARNAAALLDKLNGGQISQDQAQRLARPSATGARVQGANLAYLTKNFGAAMAPQILAARERTWVGPLRSTYGYHLIKVARRQPARSVELRAVRPAAEAALKREQRKAAVDQKLRQLRQEYSVITVAAAPRDEP